VSTEFFGFVSNMNTMKGVKNFGIGTDIESIDRFSQADHTPNSPFLNKIFTKNELEYCFSKKTAAPHLAARYAGKEAIVKALASIGKANPSYKEIEIVNNKNGAPTVRISNAGFQGLQVHLSLSHCRDKAIAFTVVMEANHKEEG